MVRALSLKLYNHHCRSFLGVHSLLASMLYSANRRNETEICWAGSINHHSLPLAASFTLGGNVLESNVNTQAGADFGDFRETAWPTYGTAIETMPDRLTMLTVSAIRNPAEYRKIIASMYEGTTDRLGQNPRKANFLSNYENIKIQVLFGVF